MKSLELNWIRKYDKALVVPEVVFSTASGYGGSYYSPDRNEIEIDGKFYDLRNGLIEVAMGSRDVDIAATLAHEWRHHWQFHRGIEFLDWPWQYSEDYDKAIFEYFQVPYEMDALLFEYRYAKCVLNDEWVSIIHKYQTV